jgi:hypothetical protein
MTLKKTLVSEGKIPFEVKGAGKECFTWYKVFGDLSSSVRPLVALHGGPGIGMSITLPPICLEIVLRLYKDTSIFSACKIWPQDSTPLLSSMIRSVAATPLI